VHDPQQIHFPQEPSAVPCCEGIVPLYNIIYLVARQKDGEACRTCRRWLINVGTHAEPYQWIHGDPIPPAVADY
jgi:hypothetical protein